MDVARVVRFVEPFEHGVALVEPCVHQCHRIGRYVSIAGNAFQRLEHFAGFGGASHLREQIAHE